MKKLIVLASACMLLTSGVYAQSVKHAIKKKQTKSIAVLRKKLSKKITRLRMP